MGKKTIVVGSCNSANDIAQDFVERGYDVTMVQRSSTCVVSSDSTLNIAFKGLYDATGPPTEDADLYPWSIPSRLFKAQQAKVTQVTNQNDAKTIEGLDKAGFKVDSGPSDSGILMKYFQRGGGYYIDVGGSQLTIDGKVKIKHGQETSQVLPHGLRFADGSELEADEIVFATGYQNMRTETRVIFGDKVADRVGDIWGLDKEGEMRTIWRRSGHPGFWFMGGNLAMSRYYSRLLALQIKALEEGVTSW
ncbi:Flavin-binding monooxygenase-like protein [Penicillium digitatum PHI26]|uniref:Flavin-binding monooxygenase-like protein n=3 Tax=Penicillium digitatum TaxID=36651 RepID=K9FM37_PEND2|nr:Flavin-binding monooxygenase-like protein [Penicillium digitatum Pd1]EKV07742.1 Flavin-binding monooxygenase-like protein [Penicillium digitatum Pd1]EKV09347.1 Flavin-binding monooxygenase-like protein [Penicillium digitatum PHI26]